MAIIMDGKRLLQKYKNDIAEHVEMMYIKPRLSVVLVGNNPASAQSESKRYSGQNSPS